MTVWRRETLPSITEIKGQKLHKEADAAVLVAGAGSPWEERGSLVRVFASATGKALYGARVRGSTSIEGAPSATGEWTRWGGATSNLGLPMTKLPFGT